MTSWSISKFPKMLELPWPSLRDNNWALKMLAILGIKAKKGLNISFSQNYFNLRHETSMFLEY